VANFPAYGGARPVMPLSETRRIEAPIWSPLRQRLFFWLWIAAIASNIGTWMQNVGAAWLMTSLSTSPLMVALIQTAASLPIFLLALPAGALADMVDRRRLLLFSQGWMTLAAGALGILTLMDLTTPWLLLTLSFALGAGAALNAPAWQAIVPEIVSREELTAAISLNSINFNIARAVGPALGGIVVSLMGAGVNFVLNAVSFLGVMAVLYAWRRKHKPSVLPTERIMGGIRTGLRYVRHSPPLRAVLFRTAAFMVGASGMWAVLPLLVRNQLGMGATGFGLLLACFGTGAVIGGTMLPWASRRMSRDAIVALNTVVFAAFSAALALIHYIPAVCLVMAIGGAAWTTTMSCLNVAAQLSVPQWVQGRALSCYQIVMQGGMAIASAIWGEVAEHWGISGALLFAAASMVLGMATQYRYLLAQANELVLDAQPPAPMPEVAGDIAPDAGPVLVTVEYQIDPKRASEFAETMREIRVIRRRDGATFWGLFFDVSRPEHYVEYFLVDSWLEHMRQHTRLTLADKDVQDRARSFHVGAEPPVVSHQIAAPDEVIR
jgi:MFS family permease